VTSDTRLRKLGAALALLALSLPAHADPARPASAEELLARQPPEVVSHLEKDKVVILASEPGPGGGPWVKALAIFERPRDQVMQLIAQSKRQIEYRPEINSIETIERFPNGTIDEQRLRIMFVSLTYRLREQIDYEQGRAWWGLDERFDNDLQRLDGYWDFYALGPDRTLGSFGTVVNIGPALPAFIQDIATRKNVPQTVDRTRRWVDSNGSWRP